MQQAYTCMENKNDFKAEASFYLGRCLFYSVQQWHLWATVVVSIYASSSEFS